MPGLLGIVGARERAAVRASFDAVYRAMDRGGRLVAERRLDARDQWALGRVHLGVMQAAPQLSSEGPLHVLVAGELHNADALRRSLGTDVVRASTDAEIIAALYRRDGEGATRQLEGAFAAAIFDTITGKLLLTCDRLGSYPLYWFMDAEQFVFASELRAALKAHRRPALNPAGVADFMKFGFPMGDKTLAAGVEMVPAGSTLRYCARTHAVDIVRHASVAELFRQEDVDRGAYLRNVEAAFSAAMDRAVRGRNRFGISLSGGLDTRVILSALDRRSCPVSSFTLGGRGCADEVIAYRLAKMARSDHRFIALDDHYLDDLLPTVARMVSLTDGMYLSHGFTEMLALQGFKESDCSVLLRGHAGELAKASTAWPLHTDRHIFSMTSTEQFVPYMMSRLSHVSRNDAARDLFSPAWVEALDGASAERSLRESIRDVSLSPADLCSYVYLKEYHRRVTIPSLEIFRNVADVRLPLADVAFLDAVLDAPAAWRDGTTIHQDLIRANGSKYLKVRNPNTGAPAGAGPAEEWVLDKLNSVLRRLNVYGYRHYHSFDGWMRRSLLSMVDSVLLAPDTLARGVFREERVRELAAAAHQGNTSHDDLLQALIIVELWQQQNLGNTVTN